MNDSSTSQRQPKAEPYSGWKKLTEEFDRFPNWKLELDPYGEITETGWIFRGHKSTHYHLQPLLERLAGKEWAALELKILAEFQSQAPMHLNPFDPRPEDRLSWLALMQHFGVPTRLLDFSFSPYVALYF